MKNLILFLIVISSLSVKSQYLCDYGMFNSETNTINGVDNINYSKIKFIKKNDSLKEQIIFIKTYDRFGRLINLETDGNGYGVPNIREGCQEIDRVYYTYSDSISPK